MISSQFRLALPDLSVQGDREGALRSRDRDVRTASSPRLWPRRLLLVDIGRAGDSTGVPGEHLRGEMLEIGRHDPDRRARLRAGDSGAQRLCHHRRAGRAEHQGPGPGLRRRRTAEWLAVNKSVEGRGIEISSARVQRAIRRGVSAVPRGHGPGPGRLPRPGLRLRDSQPDVAGDAASVGRAEGNAAGGPSRHRDLAELRSLERAPGASRQRARPKDQAFPSQLVRLPQHPLPDGEGLRGTGAAAGLDRGARDLSFRPPSRQVPCQPHGRGRGVPGAAVEPPPQSPDGLPVMLSDSLVPCNERRVPGFGVRHDEQPVEGVPSPVLLHRVIYYNAEGQVACPQPEIHSRGRPQPRRADGRRRPISCRNSSSRTAAGEATRSSSSMALRAAGTEASQAGPGTG